ncbi:MAG: hypothetical protein IIB58_13530, partial [Planctomycetes bacterium]|nr:hypothetical protein [Planctomycetota bacterium]
LNSTKGNDGIYTELVEITPAMAAEWLQNVDNRRLRKSRVKRYARDMKAGLWRLHHQGIAFACDGSLIDGQHRLWACVKSGVSIRTIVVRGLPNSVRRTIDSGAKRTVGQRFQMDDVANANSTAACINIMFQIANRLDYGTMTSSEADDALVKHPGIAHSVTHCRRAFPLLNSRLAALHYIGRYIGQPDKADDFIDVWQTGIPSYNGDAAHAARERILRSRGTSNALAPTVMSRMVLHSFNLFLARRSVKAIKLPDYYLIRGWHPEALFSPAEETIASLAA